MKQWEQIVLFFIIFIVIIAGCVYDKHTDSAPIMDVKASAFDIGEADLTYPALSSIPLCPYCKVATDRMILGMSSTCMYFPIIYKADGTIATTGKNTITTVYECLKCGKTYEIKD